MSLRKNANDIKTTFWYFARENKKLMINLMKITFTKTLFVATLFLGSCAEPIIELGDSKQVYFQTNNASATSKRSKSVNLKTTQTIHVAHELAESQTHTLVSSTSPIATPNPGTPLLESAIEQTTQQIGKNSMSVKTLNLNLKPITTSTKPMQPSKAKHVKDNSLNFSTISNSDNDGALEWKSILGLVVTILGWVLGIPLLGEGIGLFYFLFLSFAGIGLSIWGIYDLLTYPSHYSDKFTSHFFGWLNIILGSFLTLITAMFWFY